MTLNFQTLHPSALRAIDGALHQAQYLWEIETNLQPSSGPFNMQIIKAPNPAGGEDSLKVIEVSGSELLMGEIVTNKRLSVIFGVPEVCHSLARLLVSTLSMLQPRLLLVR